MTSSLVGSEMCIRDSICRTARLGKARPGLSATYRPRVSNVPREQGLRPVSYTHLTLPTICSV
eukprot:10688396-Prorocentrum_lima.AAC.1